MRGKICGSIIIAVVVAALCPILPSLAGDAFELYQIIPESVDSFVYLRDLKDGLKPLFKSDYYDEISDLSLFEAPIKSDLSAPLLSILGNVEKTTGIRPTLSRLLWVVGKRAVFFRTGPGGSEASAALLETGRFKGLLINLFSVFSSHVAKEDWGGYSVWVLSAGERKVYYKNVKGYTISSDSPDLFKSEWEIVTGQNPRTLSGNPEVMSRLSRMPKEYHILFYSTRISQPQAAEKGLLSRAGRLLAGTDAVEASVTFTEAGADIAVSAPYSRGEGQSRLADLGSLADKVTIDLSTMPGETAALVLFRAFDARILYAHFGRTWFSDIMEKVNYVTILNKWKQKGGFDLEGGIINNLGRGAAAALVGIGYEGEKPHLKTIVSVGVAPGGEGPLSENLAKLYTYSFFDTGPAAVEFGNAAISYMGQFRQKNLDWNGTSYITSVKANPGFALKDNRLFLFWDLSTIERVIDLEALASMTGTQGLFDRDFLAKSPSFLEAQKEMPNDRYDLYLFVDGNNAMSLFEGYLVNLSASYNYFLYRDSEKRLVPLVELTRRSFVSLYGGINFDTDAIQGTFKLRVKDLD